MNDFLTQKIKLVFSNLKIRNNFLIIYNFI
jgi:hypothetical protein